LKKDSDEVEPFNDNAFTQMMKKDKLKTEVFNRDPLTHERNNFILPNAKQPVSFQTFLYPDQANTEIVHEFFVTGTHEDSLRQAKADMRNGQYQKWLETWISVFDPE